MTPTLRRKLEALAERREELERLLGDPTVIGDNNQFRRLSREFAQLEPVANALQAEAQATCWSSTRALLRRLRRSRRS